MSDDKHYVISRLLFNNETCYSSMPNFEVSRGELIVIETSNGPEIAAVSGLSRHAAEDADLHKVLRKCSDEDLSKSENNAKREAEAFEITLEKIKKHGLEMKLVSIHYFLDDQKIIFNFTADGRVDFRELVKDLASVFKRRIELRQIGARDEAKIITGCGVCGRYFCCSAIKHELQPVTIKMAKDQNLTLNSSKISGACGRLLCCLAYEHEAYCQFKRNYIEEGSSFSYQGKKVTLCEINILKKTATLRSGDNVSFVIPLEELPQSKKPEKKTTEGPKKQEDAVIREA
jgi:cell fate regulator YaaT (PSP1 superfamily)